MQYFGIQRPKDNLPHLVTSDDKYILSAVGDLSKSHTLVWMSVMNKRISGGPEHNRTCEQREGRRHVRYDRSRGEPPSVAVATALAQYTGEDVVEANTQLYEYVDPEALDALFADQYSGGPRSAGEVRFTVEDQLVVVRPGYVDICER